MLRKKHGFTLVELLSVVLIIAILAAVALPQYRRSIRRAQAVEGVAHLRAILGAALDYYASFGTKPNKLQGLNVSFKAAKTPTASTTDIDNFKFTFHISNVNGALADSDTITACYMADGSNCTNTYTLTGYLKHPTYGKGTITCTAQDSVKYKTVCEALGEPTTSGGSTYLLK